MLDREFFDFFYLLNLTMNFIKGHRLSIIFCFVNLISICKFQRDIKLTVLAIDGVVIVIATNIAYPLHFSGTNLKAEIVAADTLKTARDKVCQRRCYILIIECFGPQDLQGTGVLVDKSKVKPQQIVVDFKSRLFIVSNLVDGAIARDDFKVNQRFYLFREVAGLFDIQFILNFCISFLSVSNDREDTLGIDLDGVV